MANTKSAEKALRQSKKRRLQNIFWKDKSRDAVKILKKSLLNKGADPAILKEQETALQKTLDKAVKNKAIHKNKADRLKSAYARKITALQGKTTTKKRATTNKSES